MRDLADKVRVAVVQATPVMFNKKQGVEKTVELIEKAAEKNPDLIVFPELFIPGYPLGMHLGFSIGKRDEAGREDYKRYYDNSILVPGQETDVIGEACRRCGAYVSVGVSERDPISGTLYNSNIVFRPDGTIDALHRKIKPTGSERTIWGDCHTKENYFPVTESPWGPMGVLICWESYMPLARVALYEKGVTIYIEPNTNDNPEWQDTIRHIAIEGRCFFINADMVFHRDDYPADLRESRFVDELPEMVCRGGSCIVDPQGHYVTEPVWDREEIIYADLDMQMVPASRMEFDPCGHYSRPDILEFKVNDK